MTLNGGLSYLKGMTVGLEIGCIAGRFGGDGFLCGDLSRNVLRESFGK